MKHSSNHVNTIIQLIIIVKIVCVKLISNNNSNYNFIRPSEINLYAFPKANLKLFDYIEKNGWNKLIKDF